MTPTLPSSQVSLAPQTFSTASVPQDERFAYWLDMICSVYVNVDCDKLPDTPLFGNIEFSRVGSLDLTHLRSNARRIQRTQPQIRKNCENYCLVQIQREGQGIAHQDGRVAVVNPGDFVLYDCTRPYELRFEDSHHDVVVLRLPRASLDNHVSNLEELTATTIGRHDAAGHLLMSMVETLRRDVATLHPSSAMGVSDAITSIIAAGLRGLPGANLRKNSSLQAYHVARIRTYVQDHLREPDLSIQSIAAALQLSADHISRMFRSESVMLSRLIWKSRLEACRRDLADPRFVQRTVSDIAFSWGFNNAAHFSRSFRDEFSLSPRAWRDAAAVSFTKGFS